MAYTHFSFSRTTYFGIVLLALGKAADVNVFQSRHELRCHRNLWGTKQRGGRVYT